jgi:hypothetical protein
MLSRAQPFAFFDLPAEVRVIVYKMVYARIGCSSDHRYRDCSRILAHPDISWRKCPEYWHHGFCQPRSEIGLLLTSKLIYNEAKPIFDQAPVTSETLTFSEAPSVPSAIRPPVETVVTMGFNCYKLHYPYPSWMTPQYKNIRNFWFIIDRYSDHRREPLPTSENAL